ncbi:hypothetical protein FDECE_10339 [Fusarium decemcellulare]|nr:hypothetical protein FDECE_10339 [Fusarium decemcellulare]
MYIPRTDVTPNMVSVRSVDDESRTPEVCTILILFSIISTVVVVLRTYIRLFVLRTFGFNDGIMLVALMLAIGAAVAIGMETKYGLGHHTWVQPEEDLVPYMKSFYASVVVYNVAICFVKISILLQYRRVFAVKMIQHATFYGVILMTVWTITIFFLNLLVCVPVAKFWNPALPGRCLDYLTVWYVMAGYNLVTDIAIFCLPLPVIRSLQLPRKQKGMLFGVFCLGFFTCIISIIRIRTLKVAASTKDPNWDNVDAAIWSFLEVAIAIIAACLPTLRPLFSRLMPRLFASSLGRSKGPSQYGPYAQAPSSHCLANTHNARSVKSAVGTSEGTRTLHENDNSIELSPQNYKSMPSPIGYSISVKITGGEKRGRHSVDTQPRESGESHKTAKGGIQTTTVVMQEVAVQGENEEEWDARSRGGCSDTTL